MDVQYACVWEPGAVFYLYVLLVSLGPWRRLIPGSLDTLRFVFLLFTPVSGLSRLPSLSHSLPLMAHYCYYQAVCLCWVMVCVDMVCLEAYDQHCLCPPLHVLWVCRGCSAALIRVIRWEIRWSANTESKDNHWFKGGSHSDLKHGVKCFYSFYLPLGQSEDAYYTTELFAVTCSSWYRLGLSG